MVAEVIIFIFKSWHIMDIDSNPYTPQVLVQVPMTYVKINTCILKNSYTWVLETHEYDTCEYSHK
jgi:hypothetical protein